MKAMKKFTLTVFCILAGCIFFLSGIWIYFQKSLDRVELGEGEHAAMIKILVCGNRFMRVHPRKQKRKMRM